MYPSALILCLLAAVSAAVHPSRLCGHTRDLDGRIVGGEPVSIKQFPWQVSLEEVWQSRHFCGGSIIGPTWVLTSAICTEDTFALMVTVRAGSSFRGKGGIVYKVATIIEHEEYDVFTADYDFALLEISTPISFGSNVQAVILGTSEIVSGTKVNVTGWGRTVAGGKPDQLHAVTTTIVDRDACSRAYAVVDKTVTEHMICAGEEGGGKGTCVGDTGGPLVVGNTQYGVYSWRWGCARPQYPGVYAYVPAVRSWITEKTGV